MAVELRPLGVRCNLACTYCYQNAQRQAGNVAGAYDLERMKAAVEAEGGPFTLFGGEPLLVPLADLEALWSWGFERYGRNGVQTNGVLLTAEHVALFKRYNVAVGISLDGPGELNELRSSGTSARTEAATRASEAAVRTLCAAGIPPSLIVTLHRQNASASRMDTLAEWFRELDALGVSRVRLHVLEVDDERVRTRSALSHEETLCALIALAALEPTLPRLRFDVFREIEALLTGSDAGVGCVWRACDPYTTAAVRGVEGNGRRSNCGRTNKEGVDFVKSGRASYERSLALYYTPQEHGGCRGCRYFIFCKGQCPGTAIDGDWRNRSEHCPLWIELFAHAERELRARGVVPLTDRPEREAVTQRMLEAWQRGENPALQELLA